MKAPEKIYMPNELLSEEWTRHIEGQDVEYVRTDAFIEKAVAWLKDCINNSEWVADDVGIAEEAVIIDSFITEMKYL